jgi:Fic family protein
MAIRNDGDWEGWLKFFLQGVHEVSRAATDTARAVLDLRERHREAVSQRLPASTNGLKLLDYLFEHPLLSIRMAQETLGCSYGTAGNVVQEFERLGILQEITGQQRNRLYRYEPYVSLFDRQALSVPATQGLESISTTLS